MKSNWKALVALCFLLCLPALATDVTISSGSTPFAQFPNLGPTVTGTATVSSGSAAVTSSAAFPARLVGYGGYQIVLNGNTYYTSATSSTSSITLTTNYSGSSGSVSFSISPVIVLRFYASIAFVPKDAAYVVQSGAPAAASGSFFKAVACTVSGGQIYTPQITLPATSDIANPAQQSARWSAWWFGVDGTRYRAYDCFDNFRLSATPSTQSWTEICIYNQSTARPIVDNSTLTANQIYQLLGSSTIAGTPDYLLKIPASGTGGEASTAYQSGGNIYFPGVTDLIGGVPSAAYSSLPTSSRGNGSFYFDSTNKQMRVYNSTSGLWVALNGNVFNVQDFGAKPDALEKTAAGSISSSSTILTCGTCAFTSADTGKVVYVVGAGTAGAMLKTTGTYASATTLTLAASASTTVAGATFYYGTDNTTAMQAAIDAANTADGGEVYIPTGDYIITYVSLAKKVIFRGASKKASNLWSAAASGGIVRSIWPSNASTGVWITAKDFSVTALDTRSIQYGFHDNGGTFVELANVGIYNAHNSVVFDQTEVSSIHGCELAAASPSYYGISSGKINPTSTSWTLTGSPAAAATDGTYWQLSSMGTDAAVNYTRSLSTTAFVKGFSIHTSKGFVVVGADSAGFDNAKMMRVDDGTYRYDLQITATEVKLNGGTARTANASSEITLIVEAGGAVADLWIGGTKVDNDVAGLSTAGSAVIGWGDFVTTADANIYYPPFTYYSTATTPSDIWLVNGAEITGGNAQDYTNIIWIYDNQLNSNTVHILDDGGTDHTIRDNNVNGGLFGVYAAHVVNLTLARNAFESVQWDAFYAKSGKLNGASSGGSSSGVKLDNNTFNLASATSSLPPARLTSGDTFTFTSNVWTKGPSLGNLIDVDQSGVSRVTIHNESTPNGPDSIFGTTTRSLTANQNDYAVGPFDIAYFSTDAARTITGFTGGRDRRAVTIQNIGSNDLVLANQSSSSAAANRIITGTGLDLYIGAGQSVTLVYDAVNSRWRCVDLP